jgi:hypothetical protein
MSPCHLAVSDDTASLFLPLEVAGHARLGPSQSKGVRALPFALCEDACCHSVKLSPLIFVRSIVRQG